MFPNKIFHSVHFMSCFILVYHLISCKHWPAGMYCLSSRAMPFSLGLGRDVASVGLPKSKASPPMLISQGQQEPLQCFSFEGELKIQ